MAGDSVVMGLKNRPSDRLSLRISPRAVLLHVNSKLSQA